MSVLVTGGAGFIGSHTCAELLRHGYDVVVADDFSNSFQPSLAAVRRLTGRELAIHVVDLRDRGGLNEVLGSHEISAVIHFAAKKAVAESMAVPLDYFDVNVGGTISLLRAMMARGVRKMVFSSSCSIYGDQYRRPIAEDDPPGPVNPYARSKLICEQMLEAACGTYPDLSVISAIRDYIHVMDVAHAHMLALEHLDDEHGMRALNLGTGTGASVLDLIRIFEETCGVHVPYAFADRRPGDVTSLIADAGLVEKMWGWRPGRDLATIFEDSWRFQCANPDGFRAEPGQAGVGE